MTLKPITRQEQIVAGKELEPITRMERFLKDYGVSNYFGQTTVKGDTLTWDGNTEGLVLFNIGQCVYKVSDAVPTMADLENGATIKLSDSLEVMECDVREPMPGLIMIDAGTVVVISESVVGTEISGGMLPEAGTYLYKYVEGDGQYVASLTIPGYTGFETTAIKPIDAKYLPEHLQFGEEKAFEPIVWDGNTEGLEVIKLSGESIAVKIRNEPVCLDPNEVYSMSQRTETGEEDIHLAEDEFAMAFVEQNEHGFFFYVGMVCSDGQFAYSGIKYPAGTWLQRHSNGEYLFAVNPVTDITQLEEKYMPLLTSPSGKKFKLSVDDSGVLSATEV